MGRECGGSTSPNPTTRSTRPWPRWTSLPESGRWTRRLRAASSTWDSASSGCSGSSAPDERGEHRDQPVGQLAHPQGVFCGSVTTQGGDFDGCRSFASLTCAARTASNRSLATPNAISLWWGNFGISVIGVSPFTNLRRRNADDGMRTDTSHPSAGVTQKWSKRQCQCAALARACLATDLERGLIRPDLDPDL